MKYCDKCEGIIMKSEAPDDHRYDCRMNQLEKRVEEIERREREDCGLCDEGYNSDRHDPVLICHIHRQPEV